MCKTRDDSETIRDEAMRKRLERLMENNGGWVSDNRILAIAESEVFAKVAEIRDEAAKGAAPEFREFELTFRAPYREQPEALRKVASAILLSELDRRAVIIDQLREENARLVKATLKSSSEQERALSELLLFLSAPERSATELKETLAMVREQLEAAKKGTP